MLEIEKIIRELARNRPVFHSEADFQHAFAWQIQKTMPSASIRLEVPYSNERKREYIDISVKNKKSVYGIELKYKTQEIILDFKKERFNLRNQGAQDLGMYDFIKDITRLEKFTDKNNNIYGYTILLTNDFRYWNLPTARTTLCDAFRLHENRRLKGVLSWGKEVAAGTIKDREAPLELRKEYLLHWANYSALKTKKYNEFRYLLVKIKK